MKVRHVDHVGIVVDDLEAGMAFFVDLGFTMMGRTTVEGEWVDRILGLKDVRSEIAMVQAPDGQVNIELSKFHSPVNAEGPRSASVTAFGLHHIALVVDDLDEILATLKQKGRELVGEVQTYEDAWKTCYVRGPEGIMVELGQPLKR